MAVVAGANACSSWKNCTTNCSAMLLAHHWNAIRKQARHVLHSLPAPPHTRMPLSSCRRCLGASCWRKLLSMIEMLRLHGTFTFTAAMCWFVLCQRRLYSCRHCCCSAPAPLPAAPGYLSVNRAAAPDHATRHNADARSGQAAHYTTMSGWGDMPADEPRRYVPPHMRGMGSPAPPPPGMAQPGMPGMGGPAQAYGGYGRMPYGAGAHN